MRTRRQLHVLVVDDDAAIRDLLEALLRDEGFVVEAAGDPRSALDAIANRKPDVILLDIMMPEMSGFDLMTEIRRSSDVPIIFLSARSGETDRVLGLRMGADDYVVKPFSGAELVARIYALMRRRGDGAATAPARLRFGPLTVDLGAREVSLNGAVIDTTAKEFDLLALLAASPRRVFSREQLLDRVWGSSSKWQDPSTVTEHVRRLRTKIESDPRNPRFLQTVRGVGYRFEG
ncbi:MAG TPA: response regulator transcription factor [Mycobacteriales bacterium]|nr:response regulator transcription factor [Mycobacteriales bacterium]